MFELGIQKNWIDALYTRSSVRQYTGAPDKEQLDRLGETCRKLSWQGVKIRMFKGPGLKSQIKGTDVYAVIVAKRGTPMEVEGYMGEALVLEAAKKCGKIVTVEEHNIIGGLGEAVCSLLSEKLPTPVKRIGVNDVFGHSGPAAALLKQFGLSAENIVAQTKAMLGK